MTKERQARLKRLAQLEDATQDENRQDEIGRLICEIGKVTETLEELTNEDYEELNRLLTTEGALE
jgi:transcriptional accessory protein Tex/SPT6